jgi:hypothetical protein
MSPKPDLVIANPDLPQIRKAVQTGWLRSYVARHAGEILEQFDLVLNTLSMEEAVEQAERQELGAAAAGQNHAEQDEQAGSAREGDGNDELVEQV